MPRREEGPLQNLDLDRDRDRTVGAALRYDIFSHKKLRSTKFQIYFNNVPFSHLIPLRRNRIASRRGFDSRKDRRER